MTPCAGIAEPVASLSHLGGGVLFCLVAFALVPRVRGKLPRVLAFIAYVFGVGGMFFASGTYHVFEYGHPLRGALQHLDHGMIWLAIAGTISMFLVLECPGQRKMQIGLWVIALTGLLCEAFFLAELAPWVSPLLYIGMGWFGGLPFLKILRKRGWRIGVPILVAGVLSTSGGLVDALEWPMLYAGVVEAHEVMHFFIFSGMAAFLYSVHLCLQLQDPESQIELSPTPSPA